MGLLAAALTLPVMPAAAAAPDVMAPGWSLTRTVPFLEGHGGHMGPDGALYVGRRHTVNDAVYRIDITGVIAVVAEADRVASTAVDATGQVFYTEDFSGAIMKVTDDSASPLFWTELHPDLSDADPVGMAFPDASYAGPWLESGDALVVERGEGGPNTLVRISTLAPGEGFLLYTTAEMLTQFVDVAISGSSIYLVDTGKSNSGRLLRFEDDFSLTEVPISVVLSEPVAIAADPSGDDLLVLDATTQAVWRIDPLTGDAAVFIQNIALADEPWAGLDVNAEGTQVVVTAADGLYIYSACDAPSPSDDCDGNGVLDACDLWTGAATDCDYNGVLDVCDVAAGAPDCDEDGMPDVCPSCPPLDLVFVIDTSDSMEDEASALCQNIQSVITQLQQAVISLNATVLAIDALPGEPFTCLSGTVLDLFGPQIFDAPAPYNLVGNCEGSQALASEDWALASAVVAAEYPWTEGALRIVTPISDEGPWCGNPITAGDIEVSDILAAVALEHQVIVSPILGTGAESNAQILNLAELVANATGGQWSVSTEPNQDIATHTQDLVTSACEGASDCNENGIADPCDILSGVSEDCGGDLIPDECQEIPQPPICDDEPVCCAVGPADAPLYEATDFATCEEADGVVSADAACAPVCCGGAAEFTWVAQGNCAEPTDDTSLCTTICCISPEGEGALIMKGLCDDTVEEDPKLCSAVCCHLEAGYELVVLGFCQAPAQVMAGPACEMICCQTAETAWMATGGDCDDSGGVAVDEIACIPPEPLPGDPDAQTGDDGSDAETDAGADDGGGDDGDEGPTPPEDVGDVEPIEVDADEGTDEGPSWPDVTPPDVPGNGGSAFSPPTTTEVRVVTHGCRAGGSSPWTLPLALLLMVAGGLRRRGLRGRR